MRVKRRRWDHGGRDSSDAAISQQVPAATGSWERQQNLVLQSFTFSGNLFPGDLR